MQRFSPHSFFLNTEILDVTSDSSKLVQFCQLETRNDKLGSVLTERDRCHLGEISKSWFEDVNAQRQLSVGKEDTKHELTELENNEEVKLDRSESIGRKQNAVPVQTPLKTDEGLLPHEVFSSQPLFTPDQRDKTGVSETVSDENNTKDDGISGSSSAACHSTPEVESQNFTLSTSHRQGSVVHRTESAVKLPALAISPLHRQQEETPQFVRGLLQLQTPSTINKTQETLSFSAFQASQPTPQRLLKSLGAEHDLNLSWTSSMATPQSARETTIINTSYAHLSCTNMDSPQTWKPMVAKVLFASSTVKPKKERKISFKETSSEALETLHFSSTEDEADIADRPPLKERMKRTNNNQEDEGSLKNEDNQDMMGDKAGEPSTTAPEGSSLIVEELDEKDEELMEQRNSFKEHNMEPEERGINQLKMSESMDTTGGPDARIKKRNEITKILSLDGETKMHHLGKEFSSCKNKRKVDKIEMDLNEAMQKKFKKEANSASAEIYRLEDKSNVKSENCPDCCVSDRCTTTEENDILLDRNFKREENEMGLLTSQKDKARVIMQGESKSKENDSRMEKSGKIEESNLMKVENGSNLGKEIDHQRTDFGKSLSHGDTANKSEEGMFKKSVEVDPLARDGNCEQEVKQEEDTIVEDCFGVAGDLKDSTHDHSERSKRQTMEGILGGGMVTSMNSKGSSEKNQKIVEEGKPDSCSTCKDENVFQEKVDSCLDSFDDIKKENVENVVGQSDGLGQDGVEEELVSDINGAENSEMVSDFEDGLSDRLAILAETLNIPFAQMVAADKKARELQRSSRRRRSKTKTQEDKGRVVSIEESIGDKEASINNIREEKTGGDDAVGGKIPPPPTGNCEHPNQHKENYYSEDDNHNSSSQKQYSPPSLQLSGSLPKETVNPSNIEDTLAFLLATPPLVQQKRLSVSNLASGVKVNEDTKNGQSLIEAVEERPSREQGTSKDTLKCFQSPPGNCLKSELKVTPPMTDSAPEGCIFSPLTPNMTEAILRVTEEVSSSLENSRDIDEERTPKLKNSSKAVSELPVEMERNQEEDMSVSGPNSLHNLDEENTETTLKKSSNSSNNSEGEESLHESSRRGLDLSDKGKEPSSGAVREEKESSVMSLLQLKPKGLATKLMYSALEKPASKPKVFEWQKAAVVDEAFLENEEKKNAANKENNNTTMDLPSSAGCLPKKRKFIYDSRNSHFQTFNTFHRKEFQLTETHHQSEDFSRDEPQSKKVKIREGITTSDMCNKKNAKRKLIDQLEEEEKEAEDDLEKYNDEERHQRTNMGHMGPGGDSLVQKKFMNIDDLSITKNSPCKEVDMTHESHSENFLLPDVTLLQRESKNDVLISSEKCGNLLNRGFYKETTLKLGDSAGKDCADITESVDTESVSTVAMETSSFSSCAAVGFKSASGKNISISASALERAKALMEETMEVNDYNLEDTGNSKGSDRSGQKFGKCLLQDDSTEKTHIIETEKTAQVPVLTGFSNASGKPIQVSVKALRDAEMKMQELDSDDTSKDITSNIRYENKMEELVKACDNHENKTKEATNLNKQSLHDKTRSTDSHQPNSKRSELFAVPKPVKQGPKRFDSSKDYSHIPKGFRPFKPPTQIAKNKKLLGEEKRKEDSTCIDIGRDQIVKISRTASSVDEKPDEVIDTKSGDATVREFGAEESDTQEVREIAAAEEAEMLYNFMIDEEDMVDTQLDNILTASSHKFIRFDKGKEMQRGYTVDDIVPNSSLEKDKRLSSLNSLSVEEEGGEVNKLMEGDRFNSSNGNLNEDEGGLQFNGFQTANGAKIHISDDAIERARKMLEDNENISENSVKECLTEDKQIEHEITSVDKKKRKKNVRFSEESILKTRSELKGIKDKVNVIVSDVVDGGINKEWKLSSKDNKDLSSKLRQDKEPLSNGKSELYHRSDQQNHQNVFDKSFTPGFQTASGSEVLISRAALDKAKRMWADDGCDVAEVTKIDKKPLRTNMESKSDTFSGFHSASGIKVNISDAALENAKQLWSDEKTSVSFPDSGFETASGTKMTVSSTALERAQKEWTDDSVPVNTTENMDAKSHVHTAGIVSKHNKVMPDSFTGSEVEVTITAMEEARQLPEDTDKQESVRNKVMDSCPVSKMNSHGANITSGFQTASGTKVKISQNALKKAKELMSDDSLNVNENDKMFETTAERKLAKLDSNFKSGFQTASGTKVKISQNALKKAKELMSDDSLTVSGNNKMFETSGERKLETLDGNFTSGFQTASGTIVKISQNALKKAKELMSDDSLTVSENDKMFETTAERKLATLDGNITSGFQTASGSKVKISQNALKKAKELMSEDLLTVNGKDVKLPTIQGSKWVEPDSKFQTFDGRRSSTDGNTSAKTKVKGHVSSSGFQTASGSEVKISLSALEQAQKLMISEENISEVGHKYIDGKLQNCNKSRPEQSKIARARCVPSFQTANGSKVDVSESALLKAKKLIAEDLEPPVGCMTAGKGFEETHLTNKTANIMEGNGKFCGFQTASGSHVKISEAALEKAKRLWADEGSLQEADEETGTGIYPSSSHERLERCPSGFATASGGKVTISSTSLERAKDLLTDGDEEMQMGQGSRKLSAGQRLCGTSWKEDRPDEGRLATGGFMTGKGKAVAISELALKQASERWDDNAGMEEQSASGLENGNKKLTITGHTEQVNGLYQNSASGVPSLEVSENGRCNIRNVMKEDGSLTAHERGRAESMSTMQGKVSTHHCDVTVVTPSQDDRTTPRRATPQTRQAFTSQFKQKIKNAQNAPLPTGDKEMGNPSAISPQLSINHQPMRMHPASCLTDRILTSGPLKPLNSKLRVDEQTVIRQPPKEAKIFERRRHIKEHLKEEAENEDVDMKLIWQIARLAQTKRIQSKKKLLIKPVKGALSKLKADKDRITLREAVNHELPRNHSEGEIFSAGVLPSTLLISAESASSYRFEGAEFYGREPLASSDGILSGDGGRLILGDDGAAGVKEFTSAFMDTPGVDPSLISSEWVENHYKWIVWKLASMEVAYPHHFGGRLLTPDKVLLQLKHRYDREVDQSQRSALKKILERDEAASRRMVLCVAGVCDSHDEKRETGNRDDQQPRDGEKRDKHMVLTDGWYSLKTIMDAPITGLFDAGKITVGTKLCLFGSELIGSQDACSPLEAPDSLALKISYNSTRRARFDARLGIQSDPRPFPVPLKSVRGNGGAVGCVDVIIARVYPMQYMEKYPDGSSVFRSLRAEERAAAEFLKTKQRKMEIIYSQIQKKFEEKNSKALVKKNTKQARKFTQEEVKSMTTGADLFTALSGACDPGSLEACLNPRQIRVLQDHQQSLREKQNRDLQEELRNTMAKQGAEGALERKVTTVVKMRISDYYGKKQGYPPASSMLTIWRPSEDLMTQLTEGKRFQITSLSASNARFQSGSCSAHLSSTRSTRYMERSNQENVLEKIYHARQVTSLSDLTNGCHQSVYGEVDVVGLVVSVQNDRGHSQKVYISDHTGNFVEIRVWNGLRSHHLEEVVKASHFIAASNLQMRSSSSITLHVSELSVISSNPKSKLFQEALQELRNQIKDVKELLQTTEGRISQLANGESRQVMRTPSSVNRLQRGAGSTERSVSPTKHFVPFQRVQRTPRSSTQQRELENVTPVRGHITDEGLSSSTPEEGISAKKEDIERRSSLLARIPSPPPLTPLPNKPSSRLRRGFKTPRRSCETENEMKLSEKMLNLPLDQKNSAGNRNSNKQNDISMSPSVCDEELPDTLPSITKDQVVGNSPEVMTDTQQAREEISELTDGELLELQEGWSESLSSPSSKETEETRVNCSYKGASKDKSDEKKSSVEGGEAEEKEKDESLVSDMNGSNVDEGVVKEEKGPVEVTRDDRSHTGVKSLSRRKRTRKIVTEEEGNKRRKQCQDSCQLLSSTNNDLSSGLATFKEGFHGQILQSKEEKSVRNQEEKVKEICVDTSKMPSGAKMENCEKANGNLKNQDSVSSDFESQNIEMRDDSEASQSQSREAPSQKGKRQRKTKRSNVNLALLDEINLQESPENEGLSRRLRRKPRPCYRE
ncbi:uncharacterized protein [Apostichopus japonicus]|uniref:uncharacterized protein isoform X2 n=1 Tax=Stichopus japonicus TaxID=307972 RepID=UPI003AB6D9F3